MSTDITLPETVTLTLRGTSVALIVQALNELPYKVARPVIDEIIPQLQKKPDEQPQP